MADYDPYGGGDYTRPRQTREDTYTAPQVRTSQTPTQVWEQPSTPEPQPQSYTPPPNAGSWNSYYQQPSTTQNPYGYSQQYQQPAQASPYQMNQNFQYNTGGAANTQLGQYGNRLEGFEASKLNDPTKTSAKYMFGRIASRYEPTQQGFQQLMQDPEFQRLGMQSIGNGKIRLPNGDVIDVVRGYQSGGQGWQWGAETENGTPTDWGAPAQAQGPAQDPWGQMQQYYTQQQQAYQQQQQQAYQQQQQQAYQQQQQQYAWQQYMQEQQLAQAQQWQQYMMSQPQQQPQAPQPTGYYQAPQQLPASPSYGGQGGYNTGVGLQSGGGSPYTQPYAQTFNYLAQGMPSPYYYG